MEIAVIHNKFSTTGGAETVCMNVIEALQDDYDLKLYSFDEPDFQKLNEFCGTDVDPIPINRPVMVGKSFNTMVAAANNMTNGRFGPHIQLKTAILNRLIDDSMSAFDLRISTGNELKLPSPSIQYVHYPMFNRRLLDGEMGAGGLYNEGYDFLCSNGSGVRRDTLKDATVLTNSEWTAKRIEEIYDTSSKILYPPVNVGEFDPLPWEERDPGFVAIGRISPDKNQLQLVDVIRRVRERGHDVTLHLVGPSAEFNDDYDEAVRSAAETHDFVTYEGRMSREGLVQMVCSNRYGIHGKPDEHFGITVAELVAGGTLPFVPNSGGQVELVNRQTDLLYEGIDDAVETIDSVLSDLDQQRRLRRSLPDVSEMLGQDRFQAELAAIVDEHIPG